MKARGLLIGIVSISIIGVLAFLFLKLEPEPEFEEIVEDIQSEILLDANPTHNIIGHSVQGRPIDVYTFGTGETHLIFVGGMHGGYEWNSVLLADEFINHFTLSPRSIPDYLKISIIPNLNPDGTFALIKKGGKFTAIDVPIIEDKSFARFNANNVDLNRNFDCKWKPESTWRGEIVNAGTGAFSEPESIALRDFVLENQPLAVVFWHSKANNVYASECENGVLPVTIDIMNEYAIAGNYGAVEKFDAYPVTGDAEGWLASIGIPAITVELETRDSIEWTRNLSGVNALFRYFDSEKLIKN